MKTTKTLLAALLLAAASTGWAQNAQRMHNVALESALADEFFAPELVRKYYEEIGLTEEQRSSLQAALAGVKGEYEALQAQQAAATDKVVALARQETIDEAKALAELDALMKIECDIKRMQAKMMILIRNTLTPVQRAQLRELRRGGQSAPAAPAAPAAPVPPPPPPPQK
jgi:Spy/CpxP family protein refolding chaperone